MSAPSTFGYDKQFAQEVVVAALSAFPVNSSTTLYVFTVPAGFGKVRVVGVDFVASAVLNDADGTMLVSVIARDVSEGADDTLVNAQSVEANGAAHVPQALALASESSEKEFTLEEGDSLRVTFTNNSAAIDTNGAIGVSIYMHSVPREGAGDDIKHATFYTT
jgi:hypothetical protein